MRNFCIALSALWSVLSSYLFLVILTNSSNVSKGNFWTKRSPFPWSNAHIYCVYFYYSQVNFFLKQNTDVHKKLSLGSLLKFATFLLHIKFDLYLHKTLLTYFLPGFIINLERDYFEYMIIKFMLLAQITSH